MPLNGENAQPKDPIHQTSREFGVNPTQKAPVLFTAILLALLRKCLIINGAGEGNRTLVSALGRPHSTIEPHPRSRSHGRSALTLLVLPESGPPSNCFGQSEKRKGK